MAGPRRVLIANSFRSAPPHDRWANPRAMMSDRRSLETGPQLRSVPCMSSPTALGAEIEAYMERAWLQSLAAVPPREA